LSWRSYLISRVHPH